MANHNWDRDPYLNIEILTSATSGNISTQHFGEKFDANKMYGNIRIYIKGYVPASVKHDKNMIMMFDIKKSAVKKDTDEELDKMTMLSIGDIDSDLTHWSKNITPSILPRYFFIQLDREVTEDDIENMELEMVPGFSLTWKYNKNVEPESKFSDEVGNKEFVR